MTMNINIHRVKEIRKELEIHNVKDGETVKEFFIKRLTIENNKGERFVINLFSDSDDDLLTKKSPMEDYRTDYNEKE